MINVLFNNSVLRKNKHYSFYTRTTSVKFLTSKKIPNLCFMLFVAVKITFTTFNYVLNMKTLLPQDVTTNNNRHVFAAHEAVTG